MLFVECDQWVHANCALWSYDVYEDIEGGLVNFMISYKRALTTVTLFYYNNFLISFKICSHCETSGASLFCYSKKCQNKYHFSCAFSANCAFLTSKKFYCKSCSLTKNLSNKINTDFNTNRRLYVVRNQTLFYIENTKNSKHIKEKQLDVQPNTFSRLGSLTIISAKKLNSNLAFLLSEYSIIRLFNKPRLNQVPERIAIMINLQLIDGVYTYKMSKIDESMLYNRTHLFLQKNMNSLSKNIESNTSTTQWFILDSPETFYDRLILFVSDGKSFNTDSTEYRRHHNYSTPDQENRSKDREREKVRENKKDISDLTLFYNNSKINKRELLGELLGLYNSEVKRWIKSSLIQNESEDKSSREHPSFQEYFYSENLEDFSIFERVDRIQSIYEHLSSKLKTVIQNFKANVNNDKLKNPRERSFNMSTKRIKTNRRKEVSNTIDFIPEEIGNENSIGLVLENPKYSKILNEELENKLRIEYRKHKEGPSKVFVAPSPIHKYGLFAIGK